MTRFYSAPKQFDIVYGRFPYAASPAGAGPKPHYCLVLDVFADERTDDPWVIVACGTSQHATLLYAGEFCVQAEHGRAFQQTHLGKATKFSLARDKVAKLPYNELWFAVPPERRALKQADPGIGVLDVQYYRQALAAAATAVDAARTLEELEHWPLGMLPK